jgi:hypothetical protein
MNFDDTARFFGSSEKLWPELLVSAKCSATRMCRDCRRTEVRGNQLYCGKCAYKRKLASAREAMCAKRRSNVNKVASAPPQAEAFTSAKTRVRCDDTAATELLA